MTHRSWAWVHTVSQNWMLRRNDANNRGTLRKTHGLFWCELNRMDLEFGIRYLDFYFLFLYFKERLVNLHHSQNEKKTPRSVRKNSLERRIKHFMCTLQSQCFSPHQLLVDSICNLRTSWMILHEGLYKLIASVRTSLVELLHNMSLTAPFKF